MKDPNSLARLVHEAIAQLGLSANPREVAARVERLQKGLPAEDEVSAILTWLGRCRLVHKLDQLQRPASSKEEWQVPDLLAIFSYKGQTIPVLIEVKAPDVEKETLEMSVPYRTRLTRYAEEVGLPLLIAWRWNSFWFLFDAQHMKPSPTAYKVHYGEAMKESLMCELAGDFSFSLRPGSGMHIRIRKTERQEAGWTGVIEEVYWTNPTGRRYKEAPGVFPLFLSLEQESQLQEDDSHLVQSYVIGDTQSSQFASRALVMLANLGAGETGSNWRALLEESPSPPVARDGLGEAISAASDAGFVQHVFHIQPGHLPAFLDVQGRAGAER